MKTKTLALVASIVFAALSLFGCSSEPDSYCAICNQGFTAAQCQQIAVAQGCMRGETRPSERCMPQTTGCQFFGCPAGRPIMCTFDGGTSSGADAAAEAGSEAGM